MRERVDLTAHMEDWAGTDAQRRDVARTVEAFAAAGTTIAEIVAHRVLEAIDAGGTADTELDVRFNGIILDALKGSPVAVVGSQKHEPPIPLNEGGTLAVATDPLDGLSNIDTNMAIGTIFSIYPAETGATAEAAVLMPGERQLAAGFIIYSGATKLVLTVGDGTHIYTLDRRDNRFYLTRPSVEIPIGPTEYAINASNYRFWDEPVRAYVDDLIAGSEGPRGKDFNMRWIGSLVAEVYRILIRGGIFLYPHDERPGYARGRAHLVYEANPIAFLVEQAGGGATDGVNRLLQVVPDDLHQRTPLIFGSKDKVDLVRRYYEEPSHIAERSPLFGNRSLFRT
ncbi:MAG: class 1 fructose-bisphosphatase [Hyphomicrobiales bacterium]|nr:class 1 fructose-bisphosphatase [Hyphomicrobiales bacterium]